MSQIGSFFATRIYRANLNEIGVPPTPLELKIACKSIAKDDEAGQKWCEENGYGYNNVVLSDDLNKKVEQVAQMQQIASEEKTPTVVVIDKKGFLYVFYVPSSNKELIRILNEVNNV